MTHLKWMLVALLLLTGQLFGQYTYTTFDAPGAGVLPDQGTVPLAINDFGVVTGDYVDLFGVQHGFLRSTAQQITSFDPPGAGTNPGQGTYALSINALGLVAGAYFDSTTTYHGFVWSGHGNNFTTFSVPGSNPAPYFGTLDFSINLSGFSTGLYSKIAGNATTLHGFLRSPLGVFTKFDVPGSQQTFSESINVAGTVTGYYVNSFGDVGHGFTRTLAGEFTTFDIPGCVNTFPIQINDNNVIAGQCVDSDVNAQGFVRAADGTSVIFAMPGATNTYPASIGSDGSIVGISFNPNSIDGIPLQPLQGFVRSPNGNLTVIKVPGSSTTSARSINSSGIIAGVFSDALGALHGFTAGAGLPPTILALINLVGSFNLPLGTANSLLAKLRDAQMRSPGSTASCSDLSDFIVQVKALSGNKLTTAQANQLITAANQIETTQSCPGF